jgi:IclR family pca regulon transcriptional regulator
MKTASHAQEDPLYVASLEKGMRVLGAFASGHQFMSLKEIADYCGTDKSTAQRFTHTLARLGYLEKCAKTKRFSLGKKVLELSFHFLRANALIEAATPALIELQRNCGERVNLSLFDDLSIIYAVRQSGKREYYFSSLIGRRMPVYCTAGGRAILARLPKDKAADILKRSTIRALTPRTCLEPAKIKARIDEARTKGYAVTVEESVLGEIAISAAVIDADDLPVAAIHIAGSLSEWTPGPFEQKFGPLVMETAHALSRHRPSMEVAI